ncbi:MAG: hypothetical protein LW710_00205 [Burkholderiales bacterium]|jgi:hypothetical protein|uniref:hypothetical protein n=1 Tax=Limnobacter sp. TaxID=2003368 RepID=UPI0039269073|nr:hypothetical protein [Burkholderiales bacterium]
MSSSGYFVKGVVVIVLMILAPVVGPLALCLYLLFMLIKMLLREGAKANDGEEMDSTEEVAADEYRK